jgi:hypothetical protein
VRKNLSTWLGGRTASELDLLVGGDWKRAWSGRKTDSKLHTRFSNLGEV